MHNDDCEYEADWPGQTADSNGDAVQGCRRMTTTPSLGDGCEVATTATVPPAGVDGNPPIIGDDATIRAGTVVYPNVEIGDGFTTGHYGLVRENTTIGDDVLLGTHAVVDGHGTIGDGTSLQTGVYVPTYTEIGDRVFLGPHATLTNDPSPVREDVDLQGPTLADDITIGANATLLPDVHVGEGSFVAANAVVAEDVPPETLAIGTPAEHQPLPERLTGGNRL